MRVCVCICVCVSLHPNVRPRSIFVVYYLFTCFPFLHSVSIVDPYFGASMVRRYVGTWGFVGRSFTNIWMFHFCDCSMGYVAPHPLTFPHCPVCCVSCLGKQKEGMMIVCRKFHFHNAFSIVKSNFLLRVGFGHPLEEWRFLENSFLPDRVELFIDWVFLFEGI